MGTGMPELGSKISLISKADIRYEGRLFTVDPQECTIALASVRSFGTEDRETQYPVPAQNQVYDYILFRGSDIKDIRVINNAPSLPNDPAIMQLSVPPSLGQQQFQSRGFSHPVLGAMGPPLGQFGSGYGGIGIMGGMSSIPNNLAPGMNRDFRGIQNSKSSELVMPGTTAPSEFSPAIEPTQQSNHDLIGGGSRSTTPASLGSRKSPTADQGVQTSGVKKEDKKTVKPIQPPNHRNQQRPRKDPRGEVSGHQELQHQRPQNRQPSQNRGQQHNQGQRQQQGGWGQMMRVPGQQRPRGRSRGSQNNYRNMQPNQQGNKQKSTLKFENDYDFEQANTQFEELKSQLDKLKIKDGKEVNGDCEKKDDSGNETGAGEGEQEEDGHTVYYNKAVSFFDNISCEAVERSKGRSQRTDWRAERKLNSETFGVASTRRNNNYFRGRGGYYNRGFRGSYRGGYQNTGNRRSNQENNRTNLNQGPNQNKPQQQQQQQPTTNGNNSNSSQPTPTPVPAAAGK